MKKQNSHSYIWIALIVTALLVVVRLWGLGTNPPSLNWDEASHGVNAKNVLMTGRDEWGVSFPDIFRAFGDYKLPVYIYLTSLIVGISGLSEFSVRLVSALSGLVTCWFIYLISKKEFRSKQMATIAALISLALPWHVFLSRIALEANLSLAFIVAGVYGVFFSDKKIAINLGLVSLALSMHTYNSARVVVPFLLVVALVKIVREKLIKTTLPGVFLIMISLLLVTNQVVRGTGLSRYEKLSLLSENNVYQIGQMRTNSSLPSVASKLLYNRPVYFAYRVSQNYKKYFSLAFLTQSDGAQAQFAIPGQNMILWTNTLLLLVGSGYLLATNYKKGIVILLLSLLSFLPATITDSPPQALRPLYVIPLIVLLITYGYKAIIKLSKDGKVLVFGAVFVLMLLEFGGYYWKYTNVYPKKYNNAWQPGYKEMVSKVIDKQSSYDRVIVTKYYGEPHIFFAFWNAYPTSSLMPNENNVRFKQSEWFWTDKVNKYYFVNDWDINKQNEVVKTESGLELPLSKSLLVTREENMFAGSKVVDRVYDLNGKTIFVISSYE
jgi:4-amino-4-deoxy-L-arabinose transferase-like glycosyltransferase